MLHVVKPLVGKGMGHSVDRSHCLDFSYPIVKDTGKFLPHWYQEGKIQFITFRLNDSLPDTALQEMQVIREQLLSDDFSQHSLLSATTTDFLYLREKLLEKINYWLNKGHGECLLKYAEIQTVIHDALLHHDGRSWDLYDYVIMPNHVHILIKPYEKPNKAIADFWRYTTRKIHSILDRQGPIWMPDYFDRIIRSLTDYSRYADYIRQNPTNTPL